MLTDSEKSLSIGALAFDPTDATHRTLVAGIGSFSSFSWDGGALIGLLRTTDGGTHWKAIDGKGLLKDFRLSGVAPRGNTIVISSYDDGVFRGTVTGAWRKISGSAKTGLPDGYSYDLASVPIDPKRLFTNTGTNGIYRSVDTGITWSKVSNAEMDALLNNHTVNVKIAVGRHNNVYVAIANAEDPQHEDTTGRLAALFRSGNDGDTWTVLDLPRTVETVQNESFAFGLHPAGQAETHLSIAADSSNPNIVYVGGDRQPAQNESLPEPKQALWPNSLNAMDYSGRLFRIDASLPRGRQAAHLIHSNTKKNSAPHADSRGMAFAANGALIEVDDGGIYRRANPQTNNDDWFSMNGNLQTGGLHSIAWDANSHILIAGIQDNGAPEQQATLWRTVGPRPGFRML